MTIPKKAPGKPLISMMDLDIEHIERLSDTAARFAADPSSFRGKADGARVGLIFLVPSTRTRTAFWSAAQVLGCQTLQIGPGDLQVITGESWDDTGAVLAHYLDALVVRTNGPQSEVRTLAKYVPATINALTYEEHPTQAIADLCALREQLGRSRDIRVAYLGNVNNTARSFAWLVSKARYLSLDIYAPEGHGFSSAELERLNRLSGRTAITQQQSPPTDPPPVDAIYTTRWNSMSSPDESPDWLAQFAPFAITEETMRLFARRREPFFMHDLPAVRGQEVSSAVLDGPRSLVQRQAFYKAPVAAAALLWSLNV